MSIIDHVESETTAAATPETEAPIDLLALWDMCLGNLKEEISQQEFNIWIRPLQATAKNGALQLLCPNRYFIEWIEEHYLSLIKKILDDYCETTPLIKLVIGTRKQPETQQTTNKAPAVSAASSQPQSVSFNKGHSHSNLNPRFTFESFVEGKSNQIALTAAMHVAKNPGQTYNPLSLYGGVGLGKTHLAHAVGNLILKENPNAKILYLHSERFVADMIKALQRNAMNEFKRFYRSVDALLIDDIQFFAGKERSQEEFFHTFNALLDGQQQIVLTCDRYPKEISGLEERLQSRFGWGLTVAVEPPELETRVAILMSKAKESGIQLNHDVAFFIAKNIQSNVRELEGALKRVAANAHFTGNDITVEFAREALKDLLTLQAKLVTIDNIQRTVAEYYKIKVSDLLSKRRSRSIARPRQMAMALAKKLTNHSLPEIGNAFGGRDHTTVLHACRKIDELLQTTLDIQEDHKNLLRILSA